MCAAHLVARRLSVGWPHSGFPFEPPRDFLMVGNPYLTGLWKGCPSLGLNCEAVIRAASSVVAPEPVGFVLVGG
jgi:hypothetical protein